MGTNSFIKLPTIDIGYAANVFAPNATVLATYSTLGPLTEGGYDKGQVAFCDDTASIYQLQDALPGTIADGSNILSTPDDPTRQWIKKGLVSSVVAFTSAIVDFSTIHNQPWGTDWPVIAGKSFLYLAGRWNIVNVSGTHAVSPLMSLGLNSAPYPGISGSFNDIIPSTTAFAFGALNVNVGTGLTKNFTQLVINPANNAPNPELTAIPTLAVTQAISIGAALTAKVTLTGLIVDHL